MTEKEKTEGLGISGFTIGVIGIVFSGWIGLFLSITGLVFCFVQQKRHKTKLGKVGMILGIIGIILSLLIIILYPLISPVLSEVSG